MRCDIGRLAYVFVNGGFYCDADCQLMHHLPPTQRHENTLHLFTERLVDPARLGPRENKAPCRNVRVANYLFGCSSPHHPLLWEAIEEAARRVHQLLEVEGIPHSAITDADVLWATGPDVLTSVYHEKRSRLPAGSLVVLHPPGGHRHYCAGSWRTAPRVRATRARKSCAKQVCLPPSSK